MMSHFNDWNVAYKSATTRFSESLASGSYTRDQFCEAVCEALKTLGTFIRSAALSRVDMFEGVPDHLLDPVQEFFEEVLDFYETLCLVAQHASLVLDGTSSESHDEIVPLELVFTDSGCFNNSVWYHVSSDLSKSQERAFYTLTNVSSKTLDFKSWSSADRQESLANTNVRRYPIPLAPTLGLHKTFSNVFYDLVKTFFAKKKHAHINVREGTYVGSDEFAEFIASAKMDSTLVLFDQDSGAECVEFLANGGLAAYASSKAASQTTLKALSYILGLGVEVLEQACLKTFYGQHPLLATCAYVEPKVTNPLYMNYSPLNRQYTGFNLNGKVANPSIRFSVSVASVSVSGGSLKACQPKLPVFLMKAEPAVKGKTLKTTGSVVSNPDLNAKVQVLPVRKSV